MAVTALTPKVLADLYDPLSNGDKAAFLRLIAQRSTAEAIIELLLGLSRAELERFTSAVEKPLLDLMLPRMVRDAVRIARNRPDIADEELADAVDDYLAESWQNQNTHIAAQAVAQFKEGRDRKTDPNSRRIGAEARRLHAAGTSWPKVAEALWREHGEWFPDDPRPEDLADKPGTRADLLTRIKERVRYYAREC
jgi:hypothetical protein